jgi:hypothetical protein
MIADDLNINECTVHQIVAENLNTREACAKMVPKILNDDQKARRNELSAEILERLETEPDFHSRDITGAGSRFLEYGPETKGQSEECHAPLSPREKKVRVNKKARK